MPSSPAITETARTGADSVFGYIERTAESVPDGVRWQTLSYQNKPHYDTSVFSGVAGIVLFLADYFSLTGNVTARDLAADALRWCTAPARPPSVEPGGVPLPQSLYSGAAGLGLASLRLALATGDAEAMRQASVAAERVVAAEPGPWADFGRGATGEGLFLVRLWRATGEDPHLAGAVVRGEWFRDHAIRDEHGCHWLRVDDADNPRSRSCTGWSTGSAGIGYFLLLLHEATRDEQRATLARDVAETLLKQARPDRGGLGWPYVIGRADDLARCQWCIGAPGIGFFFAGAHQVLGEPTYLAAAKAAGETTHAYGDVRGNPSQCHGLAGSAELFLELYRTTRAPLWLDRAHEFALRALRYRTATPEGDVWQADEPGYHSPDFFCGAAGAGHFFLRLQARVRLPFA